MVQLHLTRKGRLGRDSYFTETVSNKHLLMSFSRELTMMSLKTKVEWIETQLEAAYPLIPAGINDRSRFSYAMLFVGLDFFHAVAHSMLLNLDEEVAQLKQALADSINENLEDIAIAKKWSEVDNVIAQLGDMAQLALQNSPISQMIPGKTFIALPDKNELILDMRTAFTFYQRHARAQGNATMFGSLGQMAALLKNEDYFVSNERIMPDMARSRSLWVFDLKKMREKGHDVALFIDG